jgi:glucose uptake protein GlcU
MTNDVILFIAVIVIVVGIVLWDMYKDEDNEPIKQDKEQ